MLLKLILEFYELSRDAIEQGASYNALIHLPVRESIGRFKYVKEEEAETYYRHIAEELEEDVRELISKGGSADD